jgi:hypothetical protein
MPFVNEEHRQCPDSDIPGDRCYLHYREFMDMWKRSPRWTTIDEYAERIWPNPEIRAAALALLVFMDRHGNQYEARKCGENGDIL